jgi:epoxyqueuosine reductase
VARLDLRELLELAPGRFAGMFRGTPVKRLKLIGLLRNACVVAGNVAPNAGVTTELIPPLVRLAAQAAAIVRVHAVWAVQRIAGDDAPRLLAAARERETDPAVLAEYVGWPGGAARRPPDQDDP